ncbi:hypothetical protein LY76DRAFT_40861 [Colletotrichum caudatum]|nr:hypothetical protein LY76DRAFT_40861 [Colletotrichum caudatum]
MHRWPLLSRKGKIIVVHLHYSNTTCRSKLHSNSARLLKFQPPPPPAPLVHASLDREQRWRAWEILARAAQGAPANAVDVTVARAPTGPWVYSRHTITAHRTYGYSTDGAWVYRAETPPSMQLWAPRARPNQICLPDKFFFSGCRLSSFLHPDTFTHTGS